MADPGDREQARLLLYIGLAGGVLCLLTAVGGFTVTVLAPLFGLTPGSIDPTIFFLLLVWAGVAFGLVPASAIFAGRHKGDKE